MTNRKRSSLSRSSELLGELLAASLLASQLLGCSGRSGPAPGTILTSSPLITSTSTTVATAGHPFAAAVSNSGTVLVSVNADGTSGSATGVQVFSSAAGTLQPVCVNALPAALLGPNTEFANLDFFPGEADVGGGIGLPGAIFYHVADLVGCHASGFLVDQASSGSGNPGTLAVAVTPDGKFAFVSNESGVAPGASTNGNIGVVAIERDGSGNFAAGTSLIGQIATSGNAIAGMTLSPDGSRLYVTTEVSSGTVTSGAGNPVLSSAACVLAGVTTINGLLTVIDVQRAEATPGPGAILATVAAGCSPVRTTVTADGKTLWVTVRGDDRVLAFSTALLESNPDNALLKFVDTEGAAPVGLRLFHNDQFLAVANSNRFQTGQANAAILNVSLTASAAVIETIATGNFPREITLGPDDATLYLTNFESDTLQVITNTFH